MPSRRSVLLAPLLIAGLAALAPGQAQRPETPDAPRSERLDLSGPDAASPRPWGFRVSAGARAGEEATIPVPSQWELQGFGTYAYGQQDDPPSEDGVYTLDFEVPAEWANRRLELVFEGSMTDTEVELNGGSAGPAHQGGFTRFTFDVTQLARPGADNRLVVRVSERSANRSVERAERDADYWIFGGIYRPVHLDAHPPASIDHVAIDARADGTLRARVETVGAPDGARLIASVLDAGGAGLARLSGEVSANRVELEGRVARARTWSHENPRLHRLSLQLEDAEGHPLHRVERRFGFRTVEVRLEGERPGLYVNGIRTLLKGVNRHSFRPESGRALSRAQNRADAVRIRSLHFNAVRASHYPPDVAFLEACDELGLYVIDELPGWHDAYDTQVGEPLVAELVRRDVNHPSILLWANGNEGGWNPDLDDLYADHDPQRRPVIHPWDDFGGLDTGHYPSWQELVARLGEAPRGRLPWSRRASRSLVLPTEALHGLYDGGGGASLARYWKAISEARRGAGLFLWALLDEGVERVERGREIDTFGNYAPDGILDPYRRAEPSALTVREVFAPVRVVERSVAPRSGDPAGDPAGDDGLPSVLVHLENRQLERSLDATTIAWRILRFPAAFDEPLTPTVLDAGFEPGSDVGPGLVGALTIPWNDDADALELTVGLPAEDDRPALELANAVLPARTPRTLAARGPAATTETPVSASAGLLTLERGGTRVVLDAASGELRRLERGERSLRLSGGARSADGERPALRATRLERETDRSTLVVAYDHGFERAVWSVRDDGAVELSWLARDDGRRPYAGVVFDYPRERVESATWLGGGPFAVWGNRIEGATLGVWSAPALETPERVAVPLEGVRTGVRWMRLETADGTLVVEPHRDPLRPEAPGPYLGLYAPEFPAGARGATAELPEGIALLHRIPPIGSKFHSGAELVEPREPVPGLVQGRVTIVWRPPPDADPLGG